ncbi:hypothetical protein ID852_15575 [Xenorhabdus sp. 42]|nr:hypothetical protein [Xenorhabdus sp. 42]
MSVHFCLFFPAEYDGEPAGMNPNISGFRQSMALPDSFCTPGRQPPHHQPYNVAPVLLVS